MALLPVVVEFENASTTGVAMTWTGNKTDVVVIGLIHNYTYDKKHFVTRILAISALLP